MFKLKLKDGAEVSTLEELRDNFDLEATVYYFKSGELLEWLEDRFYDDEADAISQIDAEDRNLTTKICAALDVECAENFEFMIRVREKKKLLEEKTDDANIIDNAASIALNQEDLASLIQMDYETVYLCGEQFNVPIRVPDMKYIGILGTPKIKIRAKSQEELDAEHISFENVQLPWQKAAPIEELKVLAEKIFQTGGKFPIVKDGKQVSTFDKLDKVEKSAALRMICHGKYAEHQIAFLKLMEDLSSGFAMTTDAFCTGGNVGSNLIPYKKIKSSNDRSELRIERSDGSCICFSANYSCEVYNYHACQKLFSYSDYDKLARFLEVAKNF